MNLNTNRWFARTLVGGIGAAMLLVPAGQSFADTQGRPTGPPDFTGKTSVGIPKSNAGIRHNLPPVFVPRLTSGKTAVPKSAAPMSTLPRPTAGKTSVPKAIPKTTSGIRHNLPPVFVPRPTAGKTAVPKAVPRSTSGMPSIMPMPSLTAPRGTARVTKA
jgi:hypothetical protein